MAIAVGRREMPRARIRWFFGAVALAYGLIVLRLTYLQGVRGDELWQAAFSARDRTIALAARRGSILDRDGKPLATNTYPVSVKCDQDKVTDPSATAEAVAKVLGVPASEVMPAIAPPPGEKPNRSALIRDEIDPSVASAFRELRTTPAGVKALAAIVIAPSPKRVFLSGKEAVHTVGIVEVDKDEQHKGTLGLERSLDAVLRGQDGRIEAELDPNRRVIAGTQRGQTPPRDGYDVRTTIDPFIQHVARTALEECVVKHSPLAATAIVLDPKTGDVLALVSVPDFDPMNRKELLDTPGAIRNWAVTRYEPGSTLKPITAAIALDQGAIEADFKAYCRGTLRVGNRTIHCALHGGSESHGHGSLGLTGIIGRSCNVAAATLGMELGLDRLDQGLGDFGLLGRTGVGLKEEMSGLLGFRERDFAGGQAKAARVGFGQSVMVTPLALASAYGAIANGGRLVRPRLVSAYQHPDGRIARSFPPVVVRRILAPEVAAKMSECLAAVCEEGTGKGARIPGYTTAGKTGTAQKVVEGTRGYAPGKYVSSFIGYVPARNPRAVIAVVVNEPKNGYYGAQIAGPVFKAIGQRVLCYWKAPADRLGESDKF